jgi:Tol biopolymer transport system component
MATVLAIAGGCSETGSVLDPAGEPFPIHHDVPAWSSTGDIAYRDAGIVCVRRDGVYIVDTSLVGIWVLNPSTGQKKRIVPNGDTPAWSADGRNLAFSLGGQLLQTRADSVHYSLLTTYPYSVFPSWDHAGRRMAFESGPGGRRIFIQKIDGGVPFLLGQPGGGEWLMPDWSPDDSKIAHIEFPGGTTFSSEIFEVDTTGSGAVRLTSNNFTDRSPRYSPDGSLIAFSRQDASGTQVWLMNSDGTSERRLTSLGGAQPAWSPDGLEVVFVRANVSDGSPGNGVLWTMNVSTLVERQLTQKWPQRCP